MLEALRPFVAELVAELVEQELERRLAELPTAVQRPWLTIAEAAERLACSPDAVRMRVNRGRLDHRRQGRRVYVSARSVDQLSARFVDDLT
jgi:excisionase family DNA binding protein